jgi:hypothetical protein
MTEPGSNAWMKCSACRKDIPFGAVHWVCSVSTCNRARTQLVFCSVACWDAHLSTIRHREAWAVEERAPSRAEWAAGQHAAATPAARSEAPTAPLHRVPADGAPAPVRVVPSAVSSSPPPSAVPPALTFSTAYERDMLIVVSKLKKYIKDRSGMNTSDAVADVLSEHVRQICDDAIRAANADGRKTVLDRDVPRPRR